MENTFRIVSASVSDRGLSEKRPQNEDSYIEIGQSGIYAVADGVGGAQAGEVASQMAVELLGEAFTNLSPDSDVETVMRSAIGQANSAIHQMAQDLPQLANMATTVVALHIAGNIATIGHVGDSRLYRVDRDGNLFRETDDHSMVGEEVRAGRMTEEQAENHPSRNIISRALGAEATVEPDLKTILIEPGTAFLLCSDGITRHVSDGEIKGVLTFGGDPVDICEYLKGLCYERGAEDNLTAIVVRFGTVNADADPFDIDEPTVATARSPFAEKIFDDDDSMLELDTKELPALNTDGELEIVPEENEQVGNVTVDAFDLAETIEASSETFATIPDPIPTEESPKLEASNGFSMFGNSGLDGPVPTESGLMSSMLTAIGMLLLGGAIGLGVYHFVLAPKPVDQSVPPLSEMRTANIPLSAFEENRRQVDKDPVGYIAGYSTSPQDCEDYYLLGRAYLLTGDYPKARIALTESRNRLAESDPVNAKTLSADIAVALVVTNDTTIQSMLKKELDAAAKPPVNTNSNR
jgi:serine/threonine protein phosphatase PrpC